MEKNQLQNTDFKHIIGLISNAQNKAFKAVNKELVLLYWEIGSFVSGKVDSGAWGEGVVVKLAGHIKSHYPNLKGFTKRGLYRMKQFYETYHKTEKVSTLVTQLSWSNHLILLSKCKSIEEKQFYILLSVKEKLSFRELQRQIESGVFEHIMLAAPNVSTPVTQLQNNIH